MTWSARQYTKFEDERTRPVRDLVQAIPTRKARLAVDLGCGPGNSTEVLAAAFPGAEIRGLDSSPDMIAAARRRLPQFRFDEAEIGTWADPGPFDAILSNAVMHWVPGHETLFPRLAERLAPGGSLAIQMPDNQDQPSHTSMAEVAAQGPWAGRLAKAAEARTEIGSPAWYYGLLKPFCSRVDVWRTTYHHPLAGGADAIVEWFKGSGLRPFLDPLDQAEKADFLTRYRALIEKAYPALPDGSALLPFPRLFIVATR